MLAQETNQPFRRRANVPVASNISLLVQRMWIYGGSIIEKEGKKKKEEEEDPLLPAPGKCRGQEHAWRIRQVGI